MAEVANYVFLPWLRQGVGSQISEKDSLGAADGSVNERASLQVDVTLTDVPKNGGPAGRAVFSKNVLISGPGDVTGIQQRAIVRTEPPANLSNFESNNLAYVEFYEEDFLWRYTPAVADTAIKQGTRLRPWLALVVLKNETEFRFTPNPNGPGSINVVPEAFDKAFHQHTDTWAFAHVHMNHKVNNMAQVVSEVTSKLAANPDSGVSRLLCPRKLARNTAYTAFLIPAFETGRLAGLGIDVTSVKAQAPSWQRGTFMQNAGRQRSYEFPVYYQWSFKTGNTGDFESLVTLLKPTIIDGETNGTIPMDIQDPGYGLSGVADTKVVGFEAALRPANFESDEFPEASKPGDVAFRNKLKNVLNISSDLVNKDEADAIRNSPNPFYDGQKIGDDDPIIVPPVYGVWHILAQKVGTPANPGWFNDVNLDPRYRAAAGLGTKVVQEHQEDFMARAWEQVDEVNEANKKIRQAQLAEMVGNGLFKKHVTVAPEAKLLTITNPLHGFMRAGGPGGTLQYNIKESRIPVAAKLPEFQKVLRPTYKNRMNIPEMAETVLAKFNTDNPVTAAPIKTPVLGILQSSYVAAAVQAAVSSYQSDELSLAKDLFFRVAKAQKDAIKVMALPAAKLKLNTAIDAVPLAEASLPVKIKTKAIVAEIIQMGVPAANAALLVFVIKLAKYQELFYVNGQGQDVKSLGGIEVHKEGIPINPPSNVVAGSVSSFGDVKAFQANFNTFWNEKSTLADPALLPKLTQLGQLGIRGKIFPKITFSNRLRQMFDSQAPLGDLKPVMAYPVFEEAVYEYLLKLSKDYILPNVDKLERNSITLLETNPKFIESFMLGMNHEMGRELLWREYPTDQRGSYFRQFWSIRDSHIFAQTPAQKKALLESLKDIKQVHEWKNDLGTNGRGSILVLTIRGELLQKYPDTMIYAQKAAYSTPDARKARKLPADMTETNTKMPLFRAEIEPDITLVGFELTAEEAKGDRITTQATPPAGSDPGWFFVLKQRPGHVSFGFDDYTDEFGNAGGTPPAPQKWENMTWENLVDNNADLDTYHLTFNKNFNPATNPQGYEWNKNAADLASILFQVPVIFARHAAEMLPELETE